MALMIVGVTYTLTKITQDIFLLMNQNHYPLIPFVEYTSIVKGYLRTTPHVLYHLLSESFFVI